MQGNLLVARSDLTGESGLQQKQGSSGGIQSGPTIKSCDFFLNPMQQMQQILILSHPILLLFKYTNI